VKTPSLLSRRTPLAAAAPARQKGWHRLDSFSVQSQQRGNWCWAAVATSISVWVDDASAWTQCLVARRTLPASSTGGADCCADGACDVAWTLESALKTVERWADDKDVAAAFEAIKREIDARRPFAIRFAWTSGGAHFLVIDGYLDDGSDLLHVTDSIYGPSTITRGALLDSYVGANGSWTTSYWTR